MSRFQDIDSKLEQLSKQLNAVLTKDRPNYPEELRTFEERRIDWEKEHIHRAIIVQPTFEKGGVDSTKWNLVTVAWTEEGCSRRVYDKFLVEEQDFSAIADNIDSLLDEATRILTRISESELI